MDLLGVRALPYLTWRNYVREFRHLIPWAVLVGLVEGQFAGIVVAKTFHGSKLLITIASATPAAACLFSLFWGMLCAGRRKVRLLTLLGTGVALLVGTVGAIPTVPGGAVWFIVQMAAAQVLMAGVVTVRSALWRSNYPRSVRGRITSRLEGTRFVIGLVTVLTAAHLCDRNPMAYRMVFPVAGVCGLIGMAIVRRLHVRGERSELRRHVAKPEQGGLRVALPEPFGLTALLSPGHVFRRMLGVLQNDKRFARYCVAQSFTGVANLMTLPVVIAVVAQRLDFGNAWGFWISTALVQALPHLCRVGAIGRWGRFFDRVGVVRVRVLTATCWVFSLMFGLTATRLATAEAFASGEYLTLAVVFFALRGMAAGVGFGGGAIAWNLGHLHFARTEEAELYMGVHVFLTGVRGLTAPALGMLLFHWIGWGVWGVATMSACISLVLYIRMARDERGA